MKSRYFLKYSIIAGDLALQKYETFLVTTILTRSFSINGYICVPTKRLTMNIPKSKLLLFPALLAFIPGQAQMEQKEPGINTTLMDKNVNPANDFFRFVNGAWIDKTEIPADRVRWGSFDELRKRTDHDVLEILAQASASSHYTPDTDQGKAINLYKSVMDTVARNKAGIAPLKPYLAKIDAVKNVKDLQKLMTEMEPTGGIGFLGLFVSPVSKNSSVNMLSVGPGSVGLPDRDYYVSDDPDSKEKREKYELHLAKMLQYLGEKPSTAKANAAKILAFETAL